MENTQKRWYSVFFLICIMLLCCSIPFHLFIDNKLLVYILNVLLQSGFIIYYFYYVKKENLSKLQISKIDNKSFMFLPFLLICISNFIVIIFNKVILNENISYMTIIQNLLSCILVAICEEIVFRGVLFKELLKNKNPIIAMIYSSLIFGSVHLLNISSIDNIGYCIIQSIYSFGLGLIFSFMYYHSKNIILPIVFHFLFNFLNDSLVTNLFNLPWNSSFYIINSIISIIVLIYGLFLFLKLRRNK